MTNTPVLRIRTDLPGGRPRVLDTDLAVLLGYQRPKDIRFLIRGDKQAGRRYVETQERLVPGMRGTPGKDYWLTYEEAERFIARSRCPTPDHARDVLARAFQPHLLVLADKTSASRPAETSTPMTEDDVALIKKKLDELATLADIDRLRPSIVIPSHLREEVMRLFPFEHARSAFVAQCLRRGLDIMAACK